MTPRPSPFDAGRDAARATGRKADPSRVAKVAAILRAARATRTERRRGGKAAS